jgi:hypothetical protein
MRSREILKPIPSAKTVKVKAVLVQSAFAINYAMNKHFPYTRYVAAGKLNITYKKIFIFEHPDTIITF